MINLKLAVDRAKTGMRVAYMTSKPPSVILDALEKAGADSVNRPLATARFGGGEILVRAPSAYAGRGLSGGEIFG